MILSILLAVLIPLLFLYVIWSLEVYALAQRRYLFGSVGWGLGTFSIALVIQTALLRAGVFNFAQVTTLSAPILEEMLKAVFIIWLLARMKLRYAVDGTIYGFAIGIGFAVGENLLYISQNPDTAFGITVARLLSSTLIHSFTTAIVGTIAGNCVYLNRQAQVNRVGLAVVGVALVHAVYNQITSNYEGLPLLLIGITMGMGCTVILILLIHQSLKREGRSIERELSDQLSGGEIAATLNPQQLAVTLTQRRADIDPKRAQLIQDYVALQAQRAVLKKSQNLSRRSRLSRSLVLQLQGIDQQLAALRSAMGLYTWVWLRTVVPSAESALWDSLSRDLGADQPVLALIQELNRRQEEVSAADLEARKSLLREARLFHNLQDEDLDDLALLLHEHQFIVSEDVIEQGTIDERLYIVADGSLVASAFDAHKTEIIITAYDRGSSFGELTLIDQKPYPASVTCVSEVTLYSLARNDFLTLLYAKPEVGIEMMKHLVDHIRRETALLVWMQENNRSSRLERELA